MRTLWRDLRYAIRTWRRRPGAIVAALAALSLGIGANTTIFSLVSGILLEPLPYRDPDRLVMVWRDARGRGGPEREWASPGHVVDWQARGSAFDLVAAVRGWGPNLTGNGEPERLRGAAVSREYFEALGVEPRFGRLFTADEDRPGAGAVAILAFSLWERRFGRDPSVVGRSVVLDGQATTVVGVMPPTFRPPIVDAEIWTPVRISPTTASRGIITLRVLARLRAGVSLAQARSTAAVLVDPADPDDTGTRVMLVPLHEDIVGAVRPVLVVMSGTVLLVLLIACANVSHLLLARAFERGKEISIRLALGASRGEVVRQLLTEGFLLGSIGGALGLLLGWWGVRGLVAIAPATVPRTQEVGVSVSVLLFTAVVSLTCALLSSLVPAIATRRTHLTPSLKEAGYDTRTGSRVRSGLVIIEIALAMTLVAGAGLLVRSLVALQRTDLGLQPASVLTAAIAPPRLAYRDEAAVRQLYRQILDQVRAIPGIEYAASTSVLPMSGMNTDITFDIIGRDRVTGAGEPTGWFRVVSADYFAASGMRLIEGRGLNASDTEEAPGAVVINQTLARRYWPDGTALGARVRVGRLDGSIVGIVADVRHRGPMQPADAELYLASDQFSSRGAFLVLRTTGDPAGVAPAVRAAVARVDPSLPVANITSMTQLVERALAQPRFLASVLSGFSALATILALVGIYSVLSFVVTRRTREIGVRMALGAERTRVLRLIIGESLTQTAIGIVFGLGLALAVSRSMRSLLYGIGPGDPVTLGTMAILIVVAALAASYAPARRASLVDPVVALRDE